MEISVGEYGYDPRISRAMLEAGAVDVLQADATRCEGITGLLVVDGLCEATTTAALDALRAVAARARRRAPPSACGTSSTSTITRASSTCCSTARSRRATARCVPI